MMDMCRPGEGGVGLPLSNYMPSPFHAAGRVEELTKPPPMNKIVMARCSKSCGAHLPPQLPRCSRNTLVEP